MGIKDWPELSRPRERLLALGSEALSDAQLLALFIGSGLAKETAVDVAQRLIDESGSLTDFMSAGRGRMLAKPGVGLARYALLMGALELARRCGTKRVCGRPDCGDLTDREDCMPSHSVDSIAGRS